MVPGSSTHITSLDFQQVLFLPMLTRSRMFYLHQLSNYNRGIHFDYNKSNYMHEWHEEISDRGGIETSSCVLKLFLRGVTTRKCLTLRSEQK